MILQTEKEKMKTKSEKKLTNIENTKKLSITYLSILVILAILVIQLEILAVRFAH